MRLLPIRCLPQNLPEIIVVDVSGLNIGDTLHVRDIKLPPGVTVPDEELTVFLVSEPTVAEEPVAAPEEAVAPEIIKEKKAEESEATAEPKQ